MSVLVIAEHTNTELKPSTLATIAAANKLSNEIHVLVAGKDCADAAAATQQCEGVTQVLLANHANYEHALAEAMTPLIVELASEYSHILAPATTFGKNIMPRAAALLDVAQISDIIEIIDENTYQRPIYAGNAIATVSSSDSKQIVTVRATAFSPLATTGNNAPINKIDFVIENKFSQFIKAEVHGGDRPELAAAEIVVSGGRGLKDTNTFERLTAIADRIGAAIGASRAAVDAGLAPNDYQVGQTGQIVAPKLYIAIGISGAIQHLAGMKDSKLIVAINKDPDAPIFQVADYGLVADLFEVLPELEQKLTELGY